MATFARAVEMGSLKDAKPKSLYASFVISQAWQNGLARFLWLAGLFLNIGLAALDKPRSGACQFALGFRRTGRLMPFRQLSW
jgi:hypothetical protein